jgi:hypothetical protein
MAVRRVVATADMPAGEADPQMKPLAARAQTILAARDRGRQLLELYLFQMRARIGHDVNLANRCMAAARPRRRGPRSLAERLEK